MAFKVELDSDPHHKLDPNVEITPESYKELRGKVPIVHLMTVALKQCTDKIAGVYAKQMMMKAEGIKRLHEFSSKQ